MTGYFRFIGIAGLVLSIGGMALTLYMARREAKVRNVWDLVRVVISVATALVMPLITGVQTPVWLAAAAIGVGLALGSAQGLSLDVRMTEAGPRAQRGWPAVATFAVGLVLTQAASLANRFEIVEIGLAITWLSAGMTLGLIMGRHRGVTDARRVATAAALLVVMVGVVGPAPRPAAAQDDDVAVIEAVIPDVFEAFDDVQPGIFCNRNVNRSQVTLRIPLGFEAGALMFGPVEGEFDYEIATDVYIPIFEDEFTPCGLDCRVSFQLQGTFAGTATSAADDVVNLDLTVTTTATGAILASYGDGECTVDPATTETISSTGTWDLKSGEVLFDFEQDDGSGFVLVVPVTGTGPTLDDIAVGDLEAEPPAGPGASDAAPTPAAEDTPTPEPGTTPTPDVDAESTPERDDPGATQQPTSTPAEEGEQQAAAVPAGGQPPDDEDVTEEEAMAAALAGAGLAVAAAAAALGDAGMSTREIFDAWQRGGLRGLDEALERNPEPPAEEMVLGADDQAGVGGAELYGGPPTEPPPEAVESTTGADETAVESAAPSDVIVISRPTAPPGPIGTSPFDADGNYRADYLEPDGTVTRVTYDANGNMVDQQTLPADPTHPRPELPEPGTITPAPPDSLGNQRIDEIGTNGDITRITVDHDGNEITRITYDANGNVIANSRPTAAPGPFAWGPHDASGNWTSDNIAADGSVIRVTTDANGNVIDQQTLPADPTHPQVALPEPGTTTWAPPDSLGNQRIDEIGTNGDITRITVDHDGNEITRITYDANGNVIANSRPTAPPGPIGTSPFDADGNYRADYLEPDGTVTRVTYDANGNMVDQQTLPADPTHPRPELPEPGTITPAPPDSLGNQRIDEIGTNGDITRITVDHDGNEITRITYDANGNVIANSRPTAAPGPFAWGPHDASGNWTSDNIAADGSVIRVTTDANGNVIDQQTLPADPTHPQVALPEPGTTTWAPPDSLGNQRIDEIGTNGDITRITVDHDGNEITRITYDANGNVIANSRPTAPPGPIGTSPFDADGNYRADYLEPDGTVTRVTYDANGNMVDQQTLPADPTHPRPELPEPGTITPAPPDSLGNQRIDEIGTNGDITRITVDHDGNEITRITYDANGNVIANSRPTAAPGPFAWGPHDASGNWTSDNIAADGSVIRVTTDANGNVIDQQTLPADPTHPQVALPEPGTTTWAPPDSLGNQRIDEIGTNGEITRITVDHDGNEITRITLRLRT